MGSQGPALRARRGHEAAHGAEAAKGFADIVEVLLRLEALSEEAKSRAEVAIDRVDRVGNKAEQLDGGVREGLMRFGEARRLMAEVVKELNPQVESTFLVRKWQTLLG